MLEVLFFIAGLLVGWNLLDQPQWIKNLFTKWFGGSDSEN